MVLHRKSLAACLAAPAAVVLAIVVVAAAMPSECSAQAVPAIIRYNPNGPDGKGLIGPDAKVSSREDFKTTSIQYFKAASNPHMTSGIWETSGFHGALRAAKNAEFIHLIQGTITLADASGKEEAFHTGDNFLIPRGAMVQWKKTENVREFWLYFDLGPEGDTATVPAEGMAPSVIRLEPDGVIGQPWTVHDATRSFKYYGGDDKSWAGVWETQPTTSTDFHVSKSGELMIILSGTATLATRQGVKEVLHVGDVVMVPRGTDYAWSSDKTRKIAIVFDREPQTSASSGHIQ